MVASRSSWGKSTALGVAAVLGLAMGVLWSTLDFATQPRPGGASAGGRDAESAVDESVVDRLGRAEARAGLTKPGGEHPASAIPEVPSAGDQPEFLTRTGGIQVEPSALVGAGVDPGVAEEVARGLEEQAFLIQKVRNQTKIERTLAAADILFAIAPDMARLIEEGVAVIDASPIGRRAGPRVVMYDLREDCCMMTARIHGHGWDISIQIKAAGSGVDSLWERLRNAGATVGAPGRR